MKKLIQSSLILLFSFSLNLLSAQEIDVRLLPYCSSEELQTMIEEDFENYQFLINALDKGIFIATIPTQKEPVQYDGVLEINPEEEHNFLSLGLEILDRYQYYQIKDTDLMLVVLPKVFLTSK